MKWKAREREIKRLRRRNPVLAPNALPDLSVDRPSVYPSLISKRGSWLTCSKRPASPQNHGLLVDTLHKQGMQVLSRDELPWAGGKKS